VGEEVQVTEDGVSVRRLRQQTLLGSRNAGDTGRIDFGPVLQSRGGVAYWWWRVNFDNGTDGWVAEPFLEKVSASSLVTYTFAGHVTELTSDFDPGLWDILGVDVSVGSRFIGQFTYNAAATVTRPGGLNYFDGAVTDFRLRFVGGRESNLATSGSPLRNEMQTRVVTTPPYYILNMVTTLNVSGTGSRLGHSSAFHSSSPFIRPPGTTLPTSLPSVSELDLSNFFYVTMLNPPMGAQAGAIVGILDTLVRE